MLLHSTPSGIHPLNLQRFCIGERLDRVVKRAMQGGGDELALKLLRNIAHHGGAQLATKLAPYVPGLVAMLHVSPCVLRHTLQIHTNLA